MFKGIPMLLGADPIPETGPDFPTSNLPSRNTALFVGGSVVLGSLILQLGVVGLVGYGIYKLFKD